MIVDSASEVLKIPESEIETAPAMMQESGLDCVTGLGKYQGRLIILLDVGQVLTLRDSESETAAVKGKPGTKAGAGSAAVSAAKGASIGK